MNKTHTTKILKTSEGFVISCSCGVAIPGIYYTTKKAKKAADSHEKMYGTKYSELKTVKGEIEAIAKSSTSFEQFKMQVMSNGKLLRLVDKKTLSNLLQENETGHTLD
jgi:hypothetical protein